MTVTIKTDHKARPLLWLGDLTAKERAEFDYVPDDDCSDRFVRYKGWVYDVYDAQHIHYETWGVNAEPFKGWDAIVSDSFFSGVVFKFDSNGDVICGTYMA